MMEIPDSKYPLLACPEGPESGAELSGMAAAVPLVVQRQTSIAWPQSQRHALLEELETRQDQVLRELDVLERRVAQLMQTLNVPNATVDR